MAFTVLDSLTDSRVPKLARTGDQRELRGGVPPACRCSPL